MALCAGCSWSEPSIDEQLRALVTKESRRVGEETLAPERSLRAADVPDGSISKNPPTTNPSAGELRFDPADEARDVARKLEDLDRQSLGEPDPAAPPAPGAGGVTELDLPGAFATANTSARELLNAQEQYIVQAIRLLVERHRWSPRLANDTVLGAAGAGTEGSFQHTLDIVNTLKATQRLPFGGEVEARWVWRATEQLREQATGRYTQSSDLVFSGSVPLLRGAGLIAQEDLIQAERDLVYEARRFERFRRQLLVSIASDYFEITQTREEISNAEEQLVSLRELEKSTKARVDAGRINPFEYNLTANEVLQREASLAGLRERYILLVDRFKVRLGMPVERPLAVARDELELPEPEVTLEHASAVALQFRLDLQNQRDQLDDARRSVRNAQNALLPDLNLAGNVAIPTSPGAREGGVLFQPEDLAYTASLTFSLPLDRKIEALNLRQSIISLEQRVRDYERARDEVIVNVRAAVRGIELARVQLTLAEKGVEIAQKRLEEQQLKSDLVEPQKIVDTANALVDAKNARDRSKTNLRLAVLAYLLSTDQLRVSGDGQLILLPGMERPGPPAGAGPG